MGKLKAILAGIGWLATMIGTGIAAYDFGFDTGEEDTAMEIIITMEDAGIAVPEARTALDEGNVKRALESAKERIGVAPLQVVSNGVFYLEPGDSVDIEPGVPFFYTRGHWDDRDRGFSVIVKTNDRSANIWRQVGEMVEASENCRVDIVHNPPSKDSLRAGFRAWCDNR
mgnify:CR=1 FL=1|tara:strand:+ start:15376 stop:15885 length:510 start_codon:yes stop_codon:yes gene_type:complete